MSPIEPADNDRFRRAERLLAAALDLPAVEREPFLRRECGDDEQLRSLVERRVRRTEETTTGGAFGIDPGAIEEAVPDLSGSLLGRYRLVREVGRGGMGVVYEAMDETLKRTVAIKVLPARSIDPRSRERFLREAQAAAALNHPNIVALHDTGEAAERPFLVMEFVPGRSLDDRPPESIDEALAIAGQVCDALEHAHSRGLVHRDLKPGNVLVTREAGELLVKLTDMGIALARGAARVTLTGAITGTPTYMAPEQALGKQIDGRADLYSLGVMLYLWATGRPPFEGDDALSIVSQHIHAPLVPPRTHCCELPCGLEPVIVKLLAKTPEGRFASASELKQALQVVRTGEVEKIVEDRVAIEGLARGRMVGRQAELEQLQELWRAAVSGTSHLALISGEPGVGKTRLANEVTATAQLDGALALAGGCYENEATTPYLPFLEAFRRFVRERSDDQLQALLGDSAAEIARLAPEVGSRLGPFPELPTLPPQEERLRLFDHVARFLTRLAEPSGLLFFVDDLQWADHGSLALLHYLMRQLSEQRILFLGTYREVELDRTHALSKTLVDWHREHLATRVRLDRLDRDATSRMVATLLGQREVGSEFVLSLHDETEGNPFFVEEIVKALIAEGGLVHEKTGWRRQSTGEFVLPQSVKAAIGSRLERVSAPCSEVMRTAAVLGKHFEFEELASVSGRSEDELLDALDEASAAQLVAVGRGESFAFTHDKIREVLYEELNPIRRRRLHARIAEGLEGLRQRGSAVAVEDLAHHYVESGDYEKGFEYADQAADAARHVFAYDEELQMLARARECADALERLDERLRIDEAMGDAAYASGDVAGAAEHYERALAAADAPKPIITLRGKAAEVYVVPGDRRGLEHVHALQQELDADDDPRAVSHAMMIEGRYLHLAGELEQAAAKYHAAIGLAEPLGDADLLVRMYSFQAGTLQHLADFEASDAASRRCIEIGEREGLPMGILLGHEFLSENSIYRGRWKDAVFHGEQEEQLALEIHAGERYLWAQLRSYALHALGRLDEMQRIVRRAIREAERNGEVRLGLFVRMYHASCLADLGQIDKACSEAESVVREADEAGLVAHQICGRGHLIQVLLQRNRVDDAVREAGTAIELWNRGSRGTGLIYGADFAEALVRGEEFDEARRVLEVHSEIARATGARHRSAQNLRVRALLAAVEGHDAEARSALGRAIDEFAACESKMMLIRGLIDRARLGDEGDDDRSRAGELIDEVGASRELLES